MENKSSKNTRSLKITHSEIETIKIALQYVYNKKMDMLQQNTTILSDAEAEKIHETANKYLNAQAIFDGDRDI